MHRRRFLGASAVLAGLPSLCGCTGGGSDGTGTTGNDDSPIEVRDPGELLLTPAGIEVHLSEGWAEEDAEVDALFRDADALRQYVPYDEERGFHMESGTVETGVWTFEDVDGARTFYDDHPYQEGWGLEVQEVAVESIAGTGERPSLFCVLFRDANVVGGLRYENGWVDENELSTTGLNLAATMHGSWRNDGGE